MFDIWIGRINLAQAVLIVSVALFLPLQLLLCFRVRSRLLRLLPVLLLTAATLFWLVLLFAGDGGIAGVVYLIFAAYTAFMLLCCGIGWAIWGIAAAKAKGRRPPPDTEPSEP